MCDCGMGKRLRPSAISWLPTILRSPRVVNSNCSDDESTRVRRRLSSATCWKSRCVDLNRSGFSLQGFDAQGRLEPIRSVFHYLSGGATVTVPLRNHNEGEIAVAEAERAGATARLDAVALAAQTEIAAALAEDAAARQAVGLSE